MTFPIGYHSFHRNKFLNYQLNRWYALGNARLEDIQVVGAVMHSFEDYVREFTRASKQAEEDGRLKNAATYLRASEFLIPPDAPNKIGVYRNFIELFDLAFANESFERHQISYGNAHLSAIKIPSKQDEVKGVVIGCGGFDSMIEEFYGIWDFFAENGYDTIAFEGPGQGGTLRLHNLPFDHDWEKPTAAVLDYFAVEECTALGISMGGYWIIRAAAFEKRIKRVIAMPPVYDWLELAGNFNRLLLKWMLPHRGLMNFFIRLKMNVGTLRHTVKNALFITQKEAPIEAVDWMLDMNKDHLCSHLVDQEVLLLTGENDAFQPPILLKKQKAALTNARSVMDRIFLKSEHADQHCQMGNVGLAVETMLDWMHTR